MPVTVRLPTIAEELKAFSPGIAIIGAYYGLEFGSLQGLYPLMNTLRLPTITAVAALGYALWLLLNGRVRVDKVTVCYALFTLYIITNAYLLTESSENREATIKLFLTYFAYFVIGVTVVHQLDSFVLLLDILLAFMAYTCLHGMLQGGIVWGNQWLSDENIYAVFCCTGIPFAFVLFLQYPSKIKKIYYAICLSLFVIGVVLASSRGGFLAFSVIVCLFWFLSRQKLKGLLLLVILGLVAIIVAPPNILREFEQINVDAQEGNAGERTYLWRLAGNMYQDHKMTGIGIGNYGELFPAYDQMAEARDKFGGVNWRGQKMVMHSTPLSFLAETGLVGVSLLILLLVSIGYQLIYILRNEEMLLCRSFGIALASVTLSFWVGSIFLTLTVYPFFYNIILIVGVFLNLFKTEKFGEVIGK